MITGQGNGQGGREHGQKCDQLPGQRDIDEPGARAARRRGLGHSPRRDPAARASPRVEIIEAIHAARSRGCSSICFNPLVSLPDADFTREALEKLEFFARHRLLPLRDRAARRRRAARQRCRRRTRARRPTSRGASSSINKAVDPPGEAARDWRDHLRPGARGSGAATSTSPTRSRARSSTSCAWPRAAASPTTTASPTRRSTADGRLLALPDARTTRARRAFRGRPLLPPRRQGALPAGRVAADSGEPVDDEYPDLSSPPAAWSASTSRHPDPAHRRRWSISTPSRCCEIHPRLAEQLGIADGDWVTVDDPARRDRRCGRMVVTTIRPDTVFIPYHWPRERSRQPATIRALDPRQQDPRVQGLRRARDRRPTRPTTRSRAWRPRREASDVRAWRSSSTPSRCIGCQACVQACEECDTHRGTLDDPPRLHRPRATRIADRAEVCMHCEDPTCAQVCPADAIKKTRTASCSRRSSRAASAARTACSPARSASRSTMPRSTR